MTLEPLTTTDAKLLAGHPFYELIGDAYRAFKSPTPEDIGVCSASCCMSAAIAADFFNWPISKLPLEYVQEWYSGAYDPATMPKETWIYLLPRILEILAAGQEVSHIGIEVALERRNTGDPNDWTKSQWRVLDSFQRLYLASQIDASLHAIDDVICMFRSGGWALAGLLEQVASMPTDRLALKFWNDWCAGRPPGHESTWVTSFWKEPDKASVQNFYASREMYARMEALALDDKTEAPTAAKASAVADLMRVYLGGPSA